MNVSQTVLFVALLAGIQGSGAAASESAQSDAQRRKPLQRCDQLKGQAELDCLNTARKRIVEARKTRESAAGDKSKAKSAAATPAEASQAAK